MNTFLTDVTLVLEGGRAAARGQSWQSNPYLRPEQMPATTGESVRTWARKHDAWQRGFEAHGEPALAGAGGPAFLKT